MITDECMQKTQGLDGICPARNGAETSLYAKCIAVFHEIDRERRCYNSHAFPAIKSCSYCVKRCGMPQMQFIAHCASLTFFSVRVSRFRLHGGMRMWRRPFLIVFLSVLAVLPAHAFDRPFPQDAQRGTMTPAPYPEIVLNGKLRHLASGARIWNQDNQIEMPASLRGNDLPVNYTENAEGEIDRVWILSEEEASQPLAKQVNSQPR
ncbi:MAG: hypothetical protein ACM34A_18140 [Bacillota bacterium]